MSSEHESIVGPADAVDTADAAAELRRQRIAEAAYRRAEARGFVGGDTMQDWLDAEREVDASVDGAPEQGS